MFEVTEKASEMIKDFLKDKDEIPAIRLMLSQGGWSGPSLGLALDESRDGDETFIDRGLTFVIEKDFYEKMIKDTANLKCDVQRIANPSPSNPNGLPINEPR